MHETMQAGPRLDRCGGPIQTGARAITDRDMVEDAVRSILATMRASLAASEASLLAQVEDLGRTIASAKAEIAAMRVGDIIASHIPSATDELDAIVAHTAAATERILETCETLDGVSATLAPCAPGAAAATATARLQEATTRIYEACSFQDITGQRISKIVTVLKLIDEKVARMVATFGSPRPVAEIAPPADVTPAETALMSGPQLPAVAMGQTDVDKLLASFD
ncbi:MAG TPA: protein phosphatase CheZ [Acetobacteraceae bacterium]|jgi:chemotaxis protein CheZ|nr:protein phosphatase CheZ [Acetobacteraceae bacterium]